MAREEWLTRRQAAELLRVSPRTVDRWAQAGRLRRHQLGGSKRLVRFALAEVREFARSGREDAG